jgi:hypothetical protein
MIRVQLPFNTEEEQDNCSKAVEWLIERLGLSTSITSLGTSYAYHRSWRYMSPATKERIQDHLNQVGGWCLYNDLYVGTETNGTNYQQFLIKDPDIATLFKLTFA